MDCQIVTSHTFYGKFADFTVDAFVLRDDGLILL